MLFSNNYIVQKETGKKDLWNFNGRITDVWNFNGKKTKTFTKKKNSIHFCCYLPNSCDKVAGITEVTNKCGAISVFMTASQCLRHKVLGGLRWITFAEVDHNIWRKK